MRPNKLLILWSCFVCHIILRCCKSLDDLQQSGHYYVNYMLRMNRNNMWGKCAVIQIIKHNQTSFRREGIKHLSCVYMCVWSEPYWVLLRDYLQYCSWQCYDEVAHSRSQQRDMGDMIYMIIISCHWLCQEHIPNHHIWPNNAINTVYSGKMLTGFDILSVYHT